MKKLILSAIASIAVSSSVSADMIESTLYLRGDVIGSKFESINIYGHRFKEKIGPSLDVGVGYNIMDNIRTEIIYTHMFPILYKNSSNNITSYGKACADSLMLRGVIDVIDLDIAKIFAGVGVGSARVKHKVAVQDLGSVRSAAKYNLAVNLVLGTSVELAPTSHLEIGYIYADYGKTKSMKHPQMNGGSKAALRSHNVFLGIRYEL